MVAFYLEEYCSGTASLDFVLFIDAQDLTVQLNYEITIKYDRDETNKSIRFHSPGKSFMILHLTRASNAPISYLIKEERVPEIT